MASRLSDHSIDDLRSMLRATEVSAGRDSTSARIIRRELQRKLDEETRARASKSSRQEAVG